MPEKHVRALLWCFVDSTALSVCDHHRVYNHKIIVGFSDRGKGSMDRFMASSSAWLRMIAVNSWLVRLLLEVSMTASQCLPYVKGCLASWLQIADISPNRCLSSFWISSIYNSSQSLEKIWRTSWCLWWINSFFGNVPLLKVSSINSRIFLRLNTLAIVVPSMLLWTWLLAWSLIATSQRSRLYTCSLLVYSRLKHYSR